MSLSSDLSAWWFLSLALAVAGLSTYTALDLVRRVQTVRRALVPHWLTGAGVALGTGITSMHVILMHAVPLVTPIGYHPGAIASVWAMTMAISLGGFALAGGRVINRVRVFVGAGVIALGTVASEVGGIQSLGLRPGIDWHLQTLGLSALWAFGFMAAALWVFFDLRMRQQQHPYVWQAVAAVLLAVGAVASQRALVAGTNLAVQSYSDFDVILPSSILIGLSTLGTIAMLATMLISSLVETQMRRSLRQAKSELRRQTLNDPLTGLPNRLSFEAALAQAVREADGAKARFALLAISLDGFKPINEMYGHHNGDLLLSEIARRLGERTGKTDAVARLGGDEFLMLRAGDPTQEEASALAHALLEVVAAPFRVSGRDVVVTCSIGVVMYPEHGAMQTLIAHAETALRAAKSGGGESSCVFEPRMIGAAREQTDLLRDLRRALANNEFELVYQPKIHAPSGQVTGAEALLRWHHPQRGLVSPAVFIPIAERFGLIGAIGDWVIDEACRQSRAWIDSGLRMRVAINISMHQLRRADLADHIAEALKREQLDPDRLTCEITESVAMDDPERTMAMFKRLSAVGVNLSIDDFGTGYSSLAYLRKLPASELKIDRSFVLDLEASGDARAVVDAVIRLAHALGFKVVAEGVETEGQRKILCDLGCDELQGYLFAKPMKAVMLSLWAMQDEAAPGLVDFRASLFVEEVPATPRVEVAQRV